MKKTIVAAVIISLLGVSCSGPAKLPGMISLLKARWNLQSMTGQAPAAIFAERTPWLSFDTDAMKVSGNTSCNNFNGPFSLTEDGKLSFGNLAMTRMACPGTGETLFTEALKKVTNFNVQGETLSLLNGSEELMRFVKASE